MAKVQDSAPGLVKPPIVRFSPWIQPVQAPIDGVKGFAEVQADKIHSLSWIPQADHLVIKGDQAGQAGSAHPKPMLLVSSDGTQDDLVHNLARHQGQVDKPGAPWILLPALLMDGCHTG